VGALDADLERVALLESERDAILVVNPAAVAALLIILERA
jgi:hypothetical protein